MYGVQEVNAITSSQKLTFEGVNGIALWTDDGLEILRLRLLSDPGFPFWDVSYCYGKTKDGNLVRVQLPFSQLPKKNMKAALYAEAKKTGKFIKGLFNALSTLN